MKKPKARKKAGGKTIGIAWYRPSDWPRVKAEFPDADALHDTYAEWLIAAESALHHLGSSGVAVRRYTMDLDHFIGWCAAREIPADAESRSEYVAEMLQSEADNGMSNE